MSQPQTNATPRKKMNEKEEGILLDLCRYMYDNHIYFCVNDKKAINGRRLVITTEVLRGLLNKPHEPFGGV